MKKLAPYIVIAVLLVALARSCMNNHTDVVVEHTRDTVTVVKIDTVYREKTVLRSEVVLDTIFVEKAGESALPVIITSRHYSGDDYEAWVSGYRPSLDSINVFRKIVERTIREVTERKIYPRTTDLYLGFESLLIDKDYSPNIGLSVKFRNDVMLGMKVGYYRHNPYYGINVGVKLNRNGR